MSNILIAIIIVLYTMQSFLCKKYTDNYPGNSKLASPVYTVVSATIAVIVSYAVAGFKFSASWLTIALGVVNALSLFGYNYFIIKCSQSGPSSILMVFSVAGGITVPAVCACIGFGDPISIGRIISILVIFVSVYMVSKKPGEAGGKIKKSFYALCLGLGICNGIYAAIFDVQQRLTSTTEREELIAVTYFVAAVLSAIMLFARHRNQLKSAFRQTKVSGIYLIACSLVVAVTIHIVAYVLPFVNVTVLYTIENASVLLLSVLCSCLFLKEKLSLMNIVGCLTMCAGLVAVSLL